MIPRIVHYAWFSGDPMPPAVERCIASWRALLPGWELRLWDGDAVRRLDVPWVAECVAERQWAFAADYVRLYALYHEGGVYLDTDCLLFRSLEPLLGEACFIGQEWYVHIDCFTTHRYLTSHCMGAEARHPFIGRCLRYYAGRRFVRSRQADLPARLRYDQTLLPGVQAEVARLMYGYDPRPSADRMQRLGLLPSAAALLAPGEPAEGPGAALAVYPHAYFDSYHIRPFTYCQHLALGGWSELHAAVPGRITLRYRIAYHLDEWLRRLMWRLGYILTRKQ